MVHGMAAAVLVVAMTRAAVPGAVPAVLPPPPVDMRAPHVDMRAAIERAAWTSAATAPLPREALQAAPKPKRSGARIAIGAVLGAAAGYLTGAFVGYAAESKLTDGRCYDVCFKGLIIGASIGTVTGAILGGRFF
jgi:hypothetical protein